MWYERSISIFVANCLSMHILEIDLFQNGVFQPSYGRCQPGRNWYDLDSRTSVADLWGYVQAAPSLWCWPGNVWNDNEKPLVHSTKSVSGSTFIAGYSGIVLINSWYFILCLIGGWFSNMSSLFLSERSWCFCRYSHKGNIILQNEDDAIIEEMKFFKVTWLWKCASSMHIDYVSDIIQAFENLIKFSKHRNIPKYVVLLGAV